MRIINYLLGLVVIVLIIVSIGQIPVTTKQGIDFVVTEYRIPLYIKIVEFVDRDYHYKSLAAEITNDAKTDEEKAMAIFRWVRSRVRTDMPKGWPVYDDHIYNIIVRGYGSDDQINDVFTTLCAYAGLPAGWKRIFIPGTREGLVLSLVLVEGRWLIFDLYRGIYFVNNKNAVASIEDIYYGHYQQEQANRIIPDIGVSYFAFLKHLPEHEADITTRPEKQMPIMRLKYEIKQAVKGMLGKKVTETGY